MNIAFMLIMALGGIFSICGAIFNWDFFFENYKARPVVKLIGRTGARVFYVLIGLLCIFFGIMFVVLTS